MDSNMKLVMIIIASFLIIPLIGLCLSDWHRHECRLELARTGWYTPAEINEVCK